MAACALSICLLGQAHAQVKYDLYKGTGYLINQATSPNFTNADGNFNTLYPSFIDGLATLANTAGTSAYSGTSKQIWYPENSFTLCDRNNYNGTSVPKLSEASCLGQYQGYVGYTMIFLPSEGTYNFRAIINDAARVDYSAFAPTQVTSTAIDYKNLTYSSTTGPVRGNGNYTVDGSGSFTSPTTANTAPNYESSDANALFSYTASGPTYLALRMYWINWGNDNNFLIGWRKPNTTSYETIPSTNTCDPANPTGTCFPKFTITKTGPDYAKPSVAASTNPVVAAASNYISSYTITVHVAPSTTGNTTTYGTTTVTDTLPTALSWVAGTSSYTAPDGWTCSVAGQKLTCTNPNPITATTDLTFTLNNLLVATGTGAGTSFTNSANVSNPNMPEVTDATKTTKTILTNLLKSVENVTTGDKPGATALPGNILRYCITATNQGGADLSNYIIYDYAPPQLKDITNLTYTNNGASVTGSSYDASKTADAAGKPSSGLVTSPAVTLLSGTQAQLCFDGTVQ